MTVCLNAQNNCPVQNNMVQIKLNVTDIPSRVSNLKAGDKVLLCGTVYTARDAAHKKIFSLLDCNKKLPFEIKGACIYFAGPTPTPEGLVIGSCGPTTSGRMDIYSPRLLDLGLAAMVGKGERNKEVTQAIVRNNAVYFCAVGGAGALASKHIVSCEEIAFPELGCESIKKLEFKDFPVFVAIDSKGNTIFKT